MGEQAYHLSSKLGSAGDASLEKSLGNMDWMWGYFPLRTCQ